MPREREESAHEPVVTAYAISMSSKELVLKLFGCISDLSMDVEKVLNSRLDRGPTAMKEESQN